MKRLIITVLLVLTTGCTMSGKEFDTTMVNQIVDGETTENEVISLFGQPRQVVLNEAGKQLIYHHEKSTPNAAVFIPFVGMAAGEETISTTRLNIIIKDGVVTKHEYAKAEETKPIM